MITFGTDGWRDVIAEGFTFSNVREITQAIADYLKSSQKSKVKSQEFRIPNSEFRIPEIVVGYDTRFLSKEFAQEAAAVLAANGIKVFLTKDFTPTPIVSYATFHRKTAGAIVITASHNPPKYNGLKFKAPYGGSATPKIMKAIEDHYHQNIKKKKKPQTISFSQAFQGKLVEIFDPEPEYQAHLFELLNIAPFREGDLKIVVDPLYGAGQGYLRRILERLGCEVKEIHNQVNPNFGGLLPEPIGGNLKELKAAVKKGRFSLGLALDGDADRLGAVDSEGNFVNSHQIFSLILKHLVERRGLKGTVVKTVSTTKMVDKLARKYGLNLIETPIGFKYICEHILKGNVLIGGEESGGLSVAGHIPERDGILSGLLLGEIILTNKSSLRATVKRLMNFVGPCFYDRLDREVSPKTRELIVEGLRTYQPRYIDGKVVKRISTLDGFKFYFEDESWLILRPSGTEPVVRVYAEAATKKEVRALLNTGKKILNQVTSKPNPK